MPLKTSNRKKPPSDRILRSTNHKPVTTKKRAAEIPWMKHDEWTFRLVEYIENDVDFRRKLFSDATKDAKAEGRRKNTAKNSKASFHAVLAKFVFDEANEEDEDLRESYRGDVGHYTKSVSGQLQRLKKRYKEYCVELGATGAGLDPTDIRENSDIANKIEKIRDEWPFWDRLHALWRELPNFNPVGVSTTGSQEDFAGGAASLWTAPKSPTTDNESDADAGDNADDSTQISDGVAADNVEDGEEDAEDVVLTPGTNPPSKRHPAIRGASTVSGGFSSSRSSTPASATTTASSLPRKGKKRSISELLNTDYDLAESERRLTERQRMQHEEKLARYELKTQQLKLEQQREENKYKLALMQMEAYNKASLSASRPPPLPPIVASPSVAPLLLPSTSTSATDLLTEASNDLLPNQFDFGSTRPFFN